MLETAVAQLRFALPLALGRPFHMPTLDRLVEAIRETQHEFGPAAIRAEGAQVLGGPVLDEATRQDMQVRRFRDQARRGAQQTAYHQRLFAELDLDPGRLRADGIAPLPLTTSLLPLMNDLILRLAGLPFAPQVAWSSGDGQWLSVGLGDLLLGAVFPLIMRKAFGRPAGLLALGLGLAALTVMLVLLDLRLVRVTLPAMVGLGPLMVAQYLFWVRRLGNERTTWQYQQAEPEDHAQRGRASQSAISAVRL